MIMHSIAHDKAQSNSYSTAIRPWCAHDEAMIQSCCDHDSTVIRRQSDHDADQAIAHVSQDKLDRHRITAELRSCHDWIWSVDQCVPVQPNWSTNAITNKWAHRSGPFPSPHRSFPFQWAGPRVFRGIELAPSHLKTLASHASAELLYTAAEPKEQQGKRLARASWARTLPIFYFCFSANGLRIAEELAPVNVLFLVFVLHCLRI